MGTAYAVSFPPLVAGGDRYGETDNVKRIISVEEPLAHDLKRETLIHEVLHQLIYMTGLPLPAKTEEAVATVLGRSLLGHMRDNPALWRWVLQRPPKEQPQAGPAPT